MADEPCHRKITRSLLSFLAVFCQINIQEYNEINLFIKRKQAISSQQSHLNKAKHGAPLWTKLVVCLYIYLNARLCCVMYWQYQYDYDYSKLKQIDLELAKWNSTTCSYHDELDCYEFHRVSKMKEFYQTRYKEVRTTLKSFGQPIADLHWAAPATASIIIMYTFIIYLGYILLVNFKWLKPLDLYFIRIMHSESFEAMRCRQLVQDYASGLRASSDNFVLNEILKLDEILNIVASPVSSGGNIRPVRECKSHVNVHHTNTLTESNLECSKFGTTLIGPIEYDSRLRAQYNNHRLACNHLDELVRDDELLPMNRARERVDQMSSQFALMSVTNLIYSALFDSLILYALPAYFGFFHLDSPMDLLTYVELWLITEMSVLAITLYLCLLNVITTDQMKYIDWLEKRISQCIESNDKSFAKHLLRGSAEVDVINRNLVKILMECQIFLAQFKPIQAIFSFMAKGTAIVALSGPLVYRIHMMYFEGGPRYLGIYFCFVVVAFADQLLIPLTRINNSSRILYARMMSLLSQAVEFEIMLGNFRSNQNVTQIIDRHIIWQLRNILIDSKRFTQQFAANMLPSLPLTVPNLIKLHYWYVLLILSHYCKLDSWKTVLGERQDDPLSLLGDL